VGADSSILMKNCTVIPILEFQGIWLSSTGGFGVTVQATQVLVMSQGTVQNIGFSGLEWVQHDQDNES
jgi:hypothetical protein